MIPRGLLGLITYSEKRSELLLLLQKEPKTLEEIKDHFKITAPEILPHIRKLENANLIWQDGKRYILTEVGEVVTKSFDRLSRTLKMFEKDAEFWKEHKISYIPEEFRWRLYELGDYKILKGTPTEIFEPHKEFMKNILKSNTIKGVSPIFHPEYPKAFVELAKMGKNVSIITTRDVYTRIAKEYKHELEKFLEYCTFEICNEKIQVAFTVTDVFLSMGLFLRTGDYDPLKDLISFEKSAIKWGEDLFKYYENRSEKVGLRGF